MQQAGGQAGSGGGYFAPLAQQKGSNGSAAAPELAELLQAAGSSARLASLSLALLQAAEQRLQVLQQQQRYLTLTCPVTLLPGPGAEVQTQPAARQAGSVHAIESELRQLAGPLVQAAAEQAESDSSSGSADVLQLAAGALPVLQEWAAPAALQRLLQACLRQAGSGSGGSAVQQLCRRLLLDGELLEQRALAAALPAAAAAELGATLRQVSVPAWCCSLLFCFCRRLLASVSSSLLTDVALCSAAPAAVPRPASPQTAAQPRSDGRAARARRQQRRELAAAAWRCCSLSCSG